MGFEAGNRVVMVFGASCGIGRATAVCPGYVATDMTSDVDTLPRTAMTPPATIAALVSMAIGLPNEATMPELAVNCVLEP